MKKHPLFILLTVSITLMLGLMAFGLRAGRTSAGATDYAISAVKVNLTANDLIYDPVHDVMWASSPSSAGSRGNSVTPIGRDGTLGESIFVGSEPRRLALSDDGQFLYVGLDGAAAVRRVSLATGTAGLQWSLGSDFCGNFLVEDMVVLAGDAHAVAISRRNDGCSPRHEGVAIYDDGVMRPDTTPGHTGSNVIERSGTANTLYGYNNETTEYGFRVMTISEDGIATTNTVENMISGFGVDIRYADRRVYATSGATIDVDSMTLAGTYAATGLVVPDPVQDMVYFVEVTNKPRFYAFDLDTFLPLFHVDVPILGQDWGQGSAFVGLGDGLFAFVKDNGEVYLLTLFEGFEVSGRIARSNGNGIEGVVVSDGAGHSAVTDYEGVYSFIAPAGEYTLTPALEGYTFAPSSRQITLPPNATGQDFVAIPPTYRLTGRIVDQDGQPLAGIRVRSNLAGTVMTDMDGRYEFTGLEADVYAIEPEADDYRFTPSYRQVSVPPDATDVNFTGLRIWRLFLPTTRK